MTIHSGLCLLFWQNCPFLLLKVFQLRRLYSNGEGMGVGGGWSVCDRSCFLAAQESGEFGEILYLCTTPQEPRSPSGGQTEGGREGTFSAWFHQEH